MLVLLGGIFGVYVASPEGQPDHALTTVGQTVQGQLSWQRLREMDDLPWKCPHFPCHLSLVTAETQSHVPSHREPLLQAEMCKLLQDFIMLLYTGL